MPDRDQMIAQLRQTSLKLRELTANASDAALDFRPSAQEWSTREILAHLVDDEMFVMRTRLERMIKEDRPLLPPHDEQQWYASRNTARDDLPTLLADFDVQRAASLGIFAFLREREWGRVGFQPEYGQFTAGEWLESWLAHDETHLKQIAANLAAFSAQQ